MGAYEAFVSTSVVDHSLDFVIVGVVVVVAKMTAVKSVLTLGGEVACSVSE